LAGVRCAAPERISVIPTIIIFIIGQRYFQRSIAITGLK
jgi:ABC-type glycerol-3-phosphate transport system permease component